jgi:penicillin-binding protein 1C
VNPHVLFAAVRRKVLLPFSKASVSFLKRTLLITFAVLAFAAVALHLTPLPPALLAPRVESTEFLDRHGKPLRILLVDQRRRQMRTTLSEISPHLVAATLAAEDKRFFHHHGIDFLATARAVRQSLLREQTRSGASTISQQLIKLARPGPRSVAAKLSEIWISLKLESVFGKEQILEEYLNRLDYGNLQIGIAAASRFYFDKPPADLSLAESAFLAGLPKAPTQFNPHEALPAACARQLWVLHRLETNDSAAASDVARARDEPLQLRPPQSDFEAPHFVDLLLKRQGISPTNGGPVRTTLDLDLNQFVEQTIARQLTSIADKHATGGAVVIIDNPTGQVLALAGSGDYFQPGIGQINGAWTPRSPGSAMKPFTYLLALEAGAFPGTVVPDVPADFVTPTGLYRPNNYNHRFYGPVSLRFALGNSLNVAAIRALEIGGGAEKLHASLSQMGVTTLGHPADYYGPGLTLGNAEVRLLELANAFATLGRLGVYRPYRLLLDGKADEKSDQRIFDEKNAFLLADMLSDNRARSTSFGENSWLAFDFPVACKTGTSSDYRDNWCVGYTPDFTVAVWVGNPDNTAMRGITGVTGAGPIFHEIFTHLHKQRGTSWFQPPAGLRRCAIEPLTGHRVPENTPGSVTELCYALPQEELATERDAQQRVLLSGVYSDWARSSQNTLGNLATVAETAPNLRIINPPPGSVYFFDADLPAASQRIPLLAASLGKPEWSSATLAPANDRALLRPGTHFLTALDRQTGQKATTWIEVREW